MCILFEICKKTPFQKCMVWGGGGGHIIQRSTTHWTVHTNMALHRSSIFTLNHCDRQHSLFQAGLGPHYGRHPPVCGQGHISSMHMAKNSCCEALVGCVFPSQNWAAKAVASAVVRMPCSLWVHAGGSEREVRGFYAWLPGSCRVTCTHSAPPERALLHINGFCGASGEATARGVNLYEDMAAACRKEEAASNTCTVRNGQKSQTCCQ